MTLDDFPDAIIDAFFNYEPTEKVLSLKEIRWALNDDEMASMAKKIGLTVEQIMDYTSPEPNYGERPHSNAVTEAFGRQESCAGQPMEPWDSCSPDGSKILTDTGTSHSDCASDLQIIRSDGSTERLTHNEFYMDRPLGWSQDGQEIFFTRALDWASSCFHLYDQLWAISPDGTNEHRLGTFGNSFNSWKQPVHAQNDDVREYVSIKDKGFSHIRTYGFRVEIWWDGPDSFSSPMTIVLLVNSRLMRRLKRQR